MKDFFEIEEELIEKYNANDKIIAELEYIQKYSHKKIDEESQIRLTQAYELKEHLSNELSNLEEKPLTRKKHTIIINQLNAIIKALKTNYFGCRISTNQGLMFENAIYHFIIEDIKRGLESSFNAWHIPHYSYSRNSNFDHDSLKEVLIDFTESLYLNQAKNYIELVERVEYYVDNIMRLANKNFSEIS